MADTNHGAVIGDYVCSGFIYSANVGWINLGNGNPTNGIRYQNLATNDFGVNQDGLGNLNGCAWSANIGWLNFENTGHPVVNLKTGIMSGYARSANCGWISLSNAFAYVQTDTLYPGPLAPDGLPIPWLLTYFGTTNVNANADPTGKGMTIGQIMWPALIRTISTASCASISRTSPRAAPTPASPGSANPLAFIISKKIPSSPRPTGWTAASD